jgi:predicted dehydrogenase
MLDPAISNGGCLRNLGAHGLDLFLLLTGEEAEVAGAQTSSRGLGQRVDDYATVMLRSRTGILGTIEVGNLYPRDGTDGEFKVSGRDALLTVKDGVMKVITASSEESPSVQLQENPSYLVLRETLDRWQRGEPPPITAHDCYRAVRLIDQAYQMARQL